MLRLFSLAALTLALVQPGLAATHEVVIDAARFQPESLTVKKGDTVVWVNRDLVPHTATAKKGAFDSRVMDTGRSWKWRPGKAGRFEYYCTLHPNMKGVVRVE